MKTTLSVRVGRLLAATSLIVLGAATHSAAQPIVLPAGVACDFGLAINVSAPANRVQRVFTDKNGNPVRYLFAGKGNTLQFTNTDSGATLTFRTGGSVEQVTPNADGTQSWVSTGHEVLILFPTDVPAGPSTILYIGRLVFTIGPSPEFFTGVQSFTGRSTDICAALSS